MMSLLEDYGHNKCEFEGYLSKDQVHEEWLCKFEFFQNKLIVNTSNQDPNRLAYLYE